MEGGYRLEAQDDERRIELAGGSVAVVDEEGGTAENHASDHA